MTESDVLRDRFEAAMMANYGTPPLALDRGEGSRVWDADGRRYLDLIAGIAVSALGHAHPAVVDAVTAQVSKIAHTSNLFVHEPGVLLAEKLRGLLHTDARLLPRRRAARGDRPASSAGSSTFSTAVSSSIRWKAWNTNPTASRRSRASARSDRRVMSCPSSQISPAVGRSSPPRRYSRVDLPQPLGPIIATVSPCVTSRSTPSTARTRLASRPCSLRNPRVRSAQLPVSMFVMAHRSPSG